MVRFLVDGLVSASVRARFPWAPCHQHVRRGDPGAAVRAGARPGAALLGGTAAVGSYTTFSTWMLETERLAEERQHRRAVANVVVSLVLGVAAAALGRLIGGHL